MPRRPEPDDKYQRGDDLYPNVAQAIEALNKAVEFYDANPCEQLLMAVLGCARMVVRSGRTRGKAT